MVPTIDISLLGLLAAIGGFFATVWRLVCSVFEWCQKRFVLFWLGSRVGRSIAEFALFGFCYSLVILAISGLLTWILSILVNSSFSGDVGEMWRVLNLYLPVADIIDLLVDICAYFGGYYVCLGVYFHYKRIFKLLQTLSHAGRV